ncbi:MAG: trimethylamine methyltransferase family protein [Desulfosarcinaceae bacterium]|nr:trimethylamine methyltransferase family protein [Desulfosarcinaceae bacterium]
MNIPTYQVLSAAQVAIVHGHTLDILENTGIAVQHTAALKTLAEKGARVDMTTRRAHFPPALVEGSLATLPKSFVCGGRTPEFDFQVAHDAPPICRSTGGAVNLVDLATGGNRKVTLQDCHDLGRLVDALPNTAFVASQTPCDTPLPLWDILVLKALLEAGRKHIWTLVSDSKNLAYQLEMLLAVAGSSEVLAQRPIGHGIVTVLQQLHYPEDEIERLLQYGRYKIPVKVPIVPMMGTSAPTTIAGTLVQANAEAVASAVLIDLLCPGTPTWYYFFIQAMEKRTGGTLFMSPEIVLCSLGLIQMARHYRLPAAPSAYETTGARLEDILFGNGVSVSLFALAGSFENASTGCVDRSMGISKEGLVIGDEIWGHTRRLLAGFSHETEAFGLEAIKRVSTGSGHYLTDPHTRDFLRKEIQFVPQLFAHPSHKGGGEGPQSLAAEATLRAAEILSRHEVPPLDEALQGELDRIAAAARKEILGG